MADNELFGNSEQLDTISRAAAIDALCDEYCGGWQDCKHYPKCENLKVIQNLPSAQPEADERRDKSTCLFRAMQRRVRQ